MKHTFLAATLFSISTLTYAGADQKIIHLAHAQVTHPSEGQTVNRKDIDLSSLIKGHDSWHITCHYKIKGKNERTDVGLTIPGTQSVNLDQDYNPYENKGIIKKSGDLHFTLDQSDLQYGQSLVIENFDAQNDITVSGCKAIWLDG